jgi:cytochrome P450
MVIAGTDSTSNSLEWTMVELLRNPHFLKKAQDELDAVVGKDRLVKEEDVPNLKYLSYVVKEGMRLHPIGPMMLPHDSREAREIAGYYVPANTQAYVNIYAIGRDPDVWERPLEFNPERFFSTDIDFHGQDFELLSFGSGRRMCPGKNLAITLVSDILAVFLQACNWSLPPGVRGEDVDMSEVPASAVYCMANPVKVIVSPRLPMNIIFPKEASH